MNSGDRMLPYTKTGAHARSVGGLSNNLGLALLPTASFPNTYII